MRARGRRWGRALASAVLLAALVGLVPVYVAWAQGGAGAGSDGRTSTTAKEEIEYRGTDERRDLGRPVVDPPFNIVRYPSELPEGARGIRVETWALQLVEEGQLVDTIPFSGLDTTIPQIAEAIDDPTWVARSGPGTYELRAALVQAPGTTLTVRSPAVEELRLVDLPGVFLGGDDAQALVEGVTVTSWNREGTGPDTVHEDGRPFILYEDGARLDIVDAEIAHLGSDRGSAYGISWRLDGATGEVLGSEFHHNFFGIYTFEAHGLVVRDNVFRDHVFYGVDPHDFSTNLLIEDNVAYRNGSHGIIVSYGVSDSVIRHNRSFGNHGNGIVIDDGSDRNHVVANLVEGNRGDGIVLLGSGNTTVARNVIRDNRVGVRVNNHGAVGNVVRNNLIEGNRVGVEAYRGAADLRLVDNVVRHHIDTGLRLAAAHTTVRGGLIAGGDTGIDIRSLVDVDRVRIADVDRGVRVAPGAVASLARVYVDAADVGVSIDEPADTDLRSSRIDAPTAVRGPLTFAEANIMSSAPFVRSWLPIAGVAVLFVAVAFELLRGFRSRHQEPPLAPAAVWNTA